VRKGDCSNVSAAFALLAFLSHTRRKEKNNLAWQRMQCFAGAHSSGRLDSASPCCFYLAAWFKS
jgi:hypothetical protein